MLGGRYFNEASLLLLAVGESSIKGKWGVGELESLRCTLKFLSESESEVRGLSWAKSSSEPLELTDDPSKLSVCPCNHVVW